MFSICYYLKLFVIVLFILTSFLFFVPASAIFATDQVADES